MEKVNESIVKKIKGLLALANDKKDDEESQTAFIMAQKLMFKHNISMSAVEDHSSEKLSINKDQVTVYKKLFWWEKDLSTIISKNFRVKAYINLRKLENDISRKGAIIFLGFSSDVELAKEMYILAYDALKVYSNRFVDRYYEEGHYENRNRKATGKLKDSYMRGFLNGMSAKFDEQVKSMEQEYGLVVLMPVEVENAFNEMSKDFGKATYKSPPIEELEAYRKGMNDGNNIDYTKSTIDETVF